MRRLCLLLVFLVLPLLAYGTDIPQPVGWVNDFAGVISPEYKEKLESLITELQQKTSSEIAVVTVSSISPYGEIEYARLLFDNWKPGKKGKDNGVLVLLAVKERRWRIETGYGVEGVLPDGLCGEIGRNYMVPYFKQGDYAQGLYNGISKIISVLSGEEPVERPQSSASSNKSPDAVIVIILILAVVAVLAPWRTFPILFIAALLLALILGSFLLFAVFFVFIIALLMKLTSYGGGHGGGYGGGGFGGDGGGFGGFGGGGGGGGGAGGGF